MQLRQTVELVRTHYPYVPLLVWFLLRDQGPHDYWRSGLVDTAQALQGRDPACDPG